MAITLSYDLVTDNANHRNYLRSMLERFGWTRLGGSVFRYDGRDIGGTREPDWLNDVAPSLMFFRTYTLRHGILIKFLTIDASSVAMIDHSDPQATYGVQPEPSNALTLRAPTNAQSSEDRIRRMVQAAVDVLP